MPFLLSFYKPFTTAGYLVWWFWRHSRLFRHFCMVKDIEKYVPRGTIMSIVGENALLAYNLGTPGPEQKITALGVKDGQKVFVKFAGSATAKMNIINEGNILKQLSQLDYVPEVIHMYSGNNFETLLTSVFEGERYSATPVNEKILALLFQLRQIKIDAHVHHLGNFKNSFAHGDFCPWNLMKSNDYLRVFDWEMAGLYPEGYDLFTFIFQTSFLLSPGRSIKSILTRNDKNICYFFSNIDILNWNPYLKEFANLKLQNATNKGENLLAARFSELVQYAEKA